MGSGTLGFREMLYKKNTLNLCKNGIIASKKIIKSLSILEHHGIEEPD
jgi:hypothetical protein